VYTELAQRARIAIRESGGAIVDATFRRKADTDAFAGVSPLAASAAWIVCEAPPEVLLERARERAMRDSVSDAGPNIVAQELAVHGGRVMPPATPLARLDTTRPMPELLTELAHALDQQMAGVDP
jgi:predicted kinase